MGKITLYGVEQAVWGADRTSKLYFSNREAQLNYLKSHEYCNSIKTKSVTEQYIIDHQIIIHNI